MATPPVFMINTFSTFKVLNQTHLGRSRSDDRGGHRDSSVIVQGWNAIDSLAGMSKLQIDTV